MIFLNPLRKIALLSGLLSASALLATTAQAQDFLVVGKLEAAPSGYLLTAQIKGLPELLINISRESGDKFGACLKGEYVIDFEAPRGVDGVNIKEMNCLKKVDPALACKKTVELKTPLSFYSDKSKAYFVATDTCMRSAFRALGMQEKEKPQNEIFYNSFYKSVGFASISTVYSEELNMLGEVGSHDIDGALLIQGLGFKIITQPNEKIANIQMDNSLRWRFRVCDLGEENAPVYKSCLSLPERTRAQF